MGVLLNLKDQQLPPTDCGNCTGSHSDKKLRTKKRQELAGQPAAAPAIAEKS